MVRRPVVFPSKHPNPDFDTEVCEARRDFLDAIAQLEGDAARKARRGAVASRRARAEQEVDVPPFPGVLGALRERVFPEYGRCRKIGDVMHWTGTNGGELVLGADVVPAKDSDNPGPAPALELLLLEWANLRFVGERRPWQTLAFPWVIRAAIATMKDWHEHPQLGAPWKWAHPPIDYTWPFNSGNADLQQPGEAVFRYEHATWGSNPFLSKAEMIRLVLADVRKKLAEHLADLEARIALPYGARPQPKGRHLGAGEAYGRAVVKRVSYHAGWLAAQVVAGENDAKVAERFKVGDVSTVTHALGKLAPLVGVGRPPEGRPRTAKRPTKR